MRALDELFLAISHSVSFMGKTWWMLMLLVRLLLLLFAGFTLFSDEQERFVCNTIQPGCSNVCFDVFSPVSVLRLWLLHLLLLSLPHLLFATYVTHTVLSRRGQEDRSRDASPPLSLGSSSSRSPLQDSGAPRFYCSYVLVVLSRVCVETAFGAGQLVLFGLSVPRSVLCFEAPCTSGVECYVSRPTEKTLMLNFMLAVASASVLLSLADLGSSVKAMARRRRRRKEMFMEEQSSTFTTTTLTEDRLSLSASSKNALRDDKAAGTKTDEVQTTESSKLEPRHVLHSPLRPPLSPRPDRGPPPSPGTRRTGQSSSAGTNCGQQSDSSDSQDRRAWV